MPDNLDRRALQVLYAVATEPWIEPRLHLHFDRYHLCGEWFALNPAVVAREVRMAVSEMLRQAGHRQSQPEEWVAREPKPEAEVDAVNAVAVTPKQHLTLFNGWVDAGFTEEQALRMVAMMAADADR